MIMKNLTAVPVMKGWTILSVKERMLISALMRENHLVCTQFLYMRKSHQVCPTVIINGRAYLTEPFSVKTTFVHCFIQLGLEATIEKEPAGPRGG